MKLTTWWQAACTVLVALLVTACGGGSDAGACVGCNPGTIASIATSPASASIAPGQQMTFTAVARDAQGTVITGVTFDWVSSDNAIATVSTAGVATGVAGGVVTVRASAGGITSNAALTVTAVPVAGATSEALIDAALAAGQIDAETALLYKVYATFGDARLPTAFKGAAADGFEPSFTNDLIAKFDTLSPATQKLLIPFMRRPASAGSWLDPNLATASQAGPVREKAQGISRPDCLGSLASWETVSLPAHKVKVWYDKSKPAHATIASFVQNEIETRVWPKLVDAAGYGFPEPLDDTSVLGCDGGDKRLDIYIVEGLGARGFTYPDTTSNQSPAYIELRASNNLADVMPHSIAHEFMHAIQWATPMAAPHESAGYRWFNDALSNWAAGEVYPGNASLHEQASCYMNAPHLSLDSASTSNCRRGAPTERFYGAYLLFQYFSHTPALGPVAVKKMLAATQFNTTGLDAVEAILGLDGWKTYWPKFANWLWNQPPFGPARPSFAQWDQMNELPSLAPDQQNKIPADLNGMLEDSTDLDARINNLSSKYYHFTFTTDVNTRSLMFHNTFYDNYKAGENVNVQALWRLEGSTTWDGDEDWTKHEWIGLCRDLKLQRVAELVVIVSSAETVSTNPKVIAAKKPSLMRNVMGCYGFEGTATRTFRHKSWSSGQTKVTFNATFNYRPGGTPLQYTNDAEGRKRVPLAPLFSGGTLTYSEDFVDNGCAYSAHASLSDGSIVLGGTSTATLTINYFNEALPAALRSKQEQLVGTASLAYVGVGASNRLIPGTITGPQPDCGTKYETGVGAWLLTNGTDANGAPKGQPVVAPNGHLDFTFTASEPSDSIVEVFGWDLAPMRE